MCVFKFSYLYEILLKNLDVHLLSSSPLHFLIFYLWKLLDFICHMNRKLCLP